MNITELIRKYETMNIREEGREKGREEGVDIVLKVIELHKLGKSVEGISQQLQIAPQKAIEIIT
ncbi:MAG: hypothetical protein AAF573_09580 [Bacteroidota bacterium]